MALIKIVSQKTKIRDSETSRPKIRDSETQRNTRKRDFAIHSKRLQDFEIGTKISETLNFPGTIRHPYSGKQIAIIHHQSCQVILSGDMSCLVKEISEFFKRVPYNFFHLVLSSVKVSIVRCL